MEKSKQEEITAIAKEFVSGFSDIELNGSGGLIVDPLSGYLNFTGYPNTIEYAPESDHHPLVLILTFEDGSKFIPAGGDLHELNEEAHNYMWLN